MTVPRGDRLAEGDAPDGARLWEAVRALSAAERRQIECVLSRFRSLDGVCDRDQDDSNAPLVVRLPSLGGGAALQLEPLAFVQALLAQIRERAHEQSDVEAPTNSAAPPSESGAEETATSSASFSLQANDFPSLGKGKSVVAAMTVATGASGISTSVPPSVKVAKRRITTTLISTDAPYAAVAVKPPTMAASANTSSNNSHDSVWSKHSLLEKRMAVAESTPAAASPLKSNYERRAALLMGGETPPPTPPTKAAVRPLVSNPWMSPPPKNNQSERKPPSLTIVGKPKRANRVALTSTPTDSMLSRNTSESAVAVAAPSKPVEVNLQAARLYGHIIVERLAPNICREIRFLMDLLYRRTCGNATDDPAVKCTSSNEFCHNHASAAFAAATIETLEPTLVLLGSSMMQLVAKSLEDVGLCENLVARIRNAMEIREDQRVRESAKMGCDLPVETKGTAFRDYALPFCEDMDSRLNYRTPTESVVYSNREKIRDAFLGQLRTFQKKQNSLLGTESDASGASSGAPDTQQLLQDVMPENLWWFARFFVLELVQIGSNPLGESDKDLVLKIMEDKMVVKNPDRLRKLHRRFTSQKVVDLSIANASVTSGFQGGRPKANNQQSSRQGGGSSSPPTKGDKTKAIGSGNNRNAILPDMKASSKGDANDAMRSFFSDNQAFFYHFLVSCDSYQFAELVKYQLEAQFLSIWRAKTKTDPRKEFTETVLRLKVIAKFIGYLRFSPQWHWSALTSALSAKNPALEAAQREAVHTLEQSQSVHAFDVVALLEESIVSRTIARCIPWLCDFLSMLSSDVLSPSTRYVRRALLLLAYVHRSRLLDSLGETGLFVAMQIERLFQVLAANELLPQGTRWHRINEKPPAWMGAATVQALLHQYVDSPSDHSTDGLQFLYSSMFVQVCVGELDDLRGFIQMKSNPRHRKPGARRNNLLGSRTATIRKVRPLQVVSEDQLELPPSTLFADGSAERGEKDNNNSSETDDSDDPLRDAFFKLYPQLKRAVEFVVDIVVTNMCEHAVNKYVKPNADALIDSCVVEAKAQAPSFTQLILHGFQMRLDERLEDFMTTTVTKALLEANELCATRVEAALRPLVPPSIPGQLVLAATKIAQAQATAAITNLISRSLRTEFLKRVAMRKRAIVKEAGTTANSGTPSGDTSSGTDDPASTGSIARTLKFSFDGTGDADLTPLEEALHAIKTSVVAMNGLLQTAVVRGSVTTRTLASFARTERGFRRALDDAIEELAQSDKQVQRDTSLVLWSWIWRGVRLSLKVFATLITNDTGAKQESPDEHTHVGDFVANFAKTLAVIAKLESDSHDKASHDPIASICRFVAQTALSIPSSIPATALPAASTNACSTLFRHAMALAPACASLSDSTHDNLPTAIISTEP